MRAYPNISYESANSRAAQLMKDERIQAEIARWENQLRADLKIEAQEVVREITLLATADPRELTEHHVGCCRYCHGVNNLYQRTPAEYDRDIRQYQEARRKAGNPDPLGLEFNTQGGIGFNPYKNAPNPDCPECFGKGVGYERFKDTSLLSPGAARLFDGVERTRDGLKLKTRDRNKILDLAAQHTGVVKKQVELSGKGGGPIETTNTTISTSTTDPVQAAEIYRTLISGA